MIGKHLLWICLIGLLLSCEEREVIVSGPDNASSIIGAYGVLKATYFGNPTDYFANDSLTINKIDINTTKATFHSSRSPDFSEEWLIKKITKDTFNLQVKPNLYTTGQYRSGQITLSLADASVYITYRKK